MMVVDEHTPARHMVEMYRQAFLRLHQREPICQYLGNQWFNVNGETVHRAMLHDEIVRLHDLCQSLPRRSVVTAEKSVIKRLIARLRSL